MVFKGFKFRNTKALKKKKASKEKHKQKLTSIPHSVDGIELSDLQLQQIIAAVKAEVLKEIEDKKHSGDSSLYTANIQKRFAQMIASKSTAGISLLTDDVRERYACVEDVDSTKEVRDGGTVRNTKEESPATFDIRIRTAPSGESCWVELKLKDQTIVDDNDNDKNANYNETREPETDMKQILYSDCVPLKKEWTESDDEKQKSNVIPYDSNEIVSNQREKFKAPSGDSCWKELRLKIPINDEKAIEDISNKKSLGYVNDEDSGNEVMIVVENNEANTMLAADASTTDLECKSTSSTGDFLRLTHQKAFSDVEDCQEAVEKSQISENDVQTDMTKAEHEVLAEK